MTEQSKNAILNFIDDDVDFHAKNLNKDTEKIRYKDTENRAKDRQQLALYNISFLRSKLKYGIIRCDYEYTPTRGDPGAPESFTSRSKMLKVEGWTFEAVQRGIRDGKYPAGEIMIKDRYGNRDEAYGWKLWNNFPETGGSWTNRNQADYEQVTTKPVDGYFHEDDYKLGIVYRYSPEAIERNMKKTIKCLEDEGVCGISADVGYSQAFQESVREMAKVPVALSALQQLPFLSAMYDLSKEKKNVIMVMTANGDSFRDNLDNLLPPGTDRDTIKIVGSLGKDFGDSKFGEWVRDGKSFSRFKSDAFDDASVEEGLESMRDRCAEGIKAAEKDGSNVVCIVLECAEMPAYSNHLRKSFGVPVYDTFTAIEFVQAGRGFGQYSAYMMPQSRIVW